MKAKKLKIWQILVLGGGTVVTFCLVCMAGSLMLTALSPAPTQPPTVVDAVGLALETLRAATKLAPIATSQPTDLPATDSLAPPTPVLPENTPTSMPTEIALSPGQRSGGVSLVGDGATAACVPNNPQERAMVVRVIDGDTIEVVMREQTFRVRYIGVDTPESTTSQEPFGKEASAKNTSLVNNQQVIMVKDVSETDQFDRLLRYVFVNGIFVNLDLVKNGYAMAATYPPDVACADTFTQAQQEAQAAKVGLWGLTPTQAVVPPTAAPPPPPAGQAPCNCSGPDLNCGDFSTHAKAQACFDYCRSHNFGDVFRLDADGNGQACENLP